MMKVRHVLALVGLVLLSLLSSLAEAQIFDNRPDAVVCPVVAISGRPGGLVVFHLVWHDDNGSTHYATMGTQTFRLEIGADDVVRAPKLEGCDGKTVEELRASERAFYYR